MGALGGAYGPAVDFGLWKTPSAKVADWCMLGAWRQSNKPKG
jgi:hypothetical protein